ncbi:MAG: Dyp-type peroxidase [Cyanosarcina radialis HA8281-LM2]|jgi:Dyp-type peroxidase family|nr:Dyp-type peroxidase [Cyanosarcina radialis HA8281-LM2]
MADIPQEEVLEIADIQGNILAGFNKDFQCFLFLKIFDRPIAKSWLSSLVPYIASTQEVLLFNQMFRTLRARRGTDPQGMAATWINIAFTYEGIKKLTSEEEANKFPDTPFRVGLPLRSGLIGDPRDIEAEGHPNQWVVGGNSNNASKYPDLLLILASDTPAYLEAEVNRLKSEILALPQPQNNDAGKALEIIYEQRGETRPDLPGHEHFGFKDGISQPGVRGRISSADRDFLTPRAIAPEDLNATLYAKPGQPLIWPGQFVLGYNRQKPDDAIAPQPPSPPAPDWAKNGSYLVLRRLRQDVPAFWQFVTDRAAKLSQKAGFANMTPERLASLLIGRWPSGAPIMRSPNSENASLGQDSVANNYFLYVDSTPEPLAVTIPDYPGDRFPSSPGDSLGNICPFFAHIRKVNPRDMATESGAGNKTLTRLILRRGIVFGSPMKDASNPTPEELQEERGLMFLSYQTSIKEQFEFVTGTWVNQPDQPPPNPPNAGVDPIIGQQNQAGSRTRKLKFKGTDGSIEEIETPVDWVIPTGGGYFFAPAIGALRDVLAK